MEVCAACPFDKVPIIYACKCKAQQAPSTLVLCKRMACLGLHSAHCCAHPAASCSMPQVPQGTCVTTHIEQLRHCRSEAQLGAVLCCAALRCAGQCCEGQCCEGRCCEGQCKPQSTSLLQVTILLRALQATPANWPYNHDSIGKKGWAFLLPTVTPEDANMHFPDHHSCKVISKSV